MELKPGCKLTEVGVIPEDWEVKTIGAIAQTVRGGSPRPAGDPRYFNGSFIPWLTVAALTNISGSQLLVTDTASCLTEEGAVYSRVLNKGTVIIANSGATLGVAKILGVKCCANDGIAALLNFDRKTSPQYLVHFINSKTEQLRNVVATGNGQPNLNTDLISRFAIPIPPTRAEQEAIAAALSDADALIEGLEQLIAKKRHIKQGAMQELLTGKKRLPGFSGEWEATTLRRILKTPVTDGPHLTPRFLQDGIPFLSVNNLVDNRIDFSDLRFVSKEDHETFSKKCKPEKGDLLLGKAASVGKVALVETELDFNIWSPIALIRVNELQEPKFIYYIFQGQALIKQITILTNSSSQGNIGMGDIEKLTLLLPTKAEQTAIATILSDMDAEITALGAKLGKARQVKQGMMHNLLTGQIRLV